MSDRMPDRIVRISEWIVGIDARKDAGEDVRIDAR